MAQFGTTRLHIIWVVFSIFWMALPSVQAAEEPSKIRQDTVYFKRIAVTPFLVGHRQPNMDESLDDTLSCPINDICVDDPSIQPDAGPMLMRLVHSALKGRFDRNVIPLDQVQTAYDGIRLNGDKDSPRTLALRMGESLSADLMVVGTVWRYRDRGALEGFPDKPASVAFALYVVEPKTGRQIWRGVFDEAQEIVFRDMANFSKRIKMGLKWLTVHELARHGVNEVFRPFPANIKAEIMTEGKPVEVK